MSEMLPVLVIGAGVFGASFAYELAARGRSVVLTERGEFAGGTSANSMKTLHGGIRHLARLDVAQVIGSIKARAHVATLFPDLVRPVRFIAPAMSAIESPATHRIAAMAYNVLCRLFDGSGLSRSSPATMIRPPDHPDLFQHLNVPLATSALTWMDLQVVETELLVLRLLKAAEEGGASVRDHSEVIDIEPRSTRYRVTIRSTGTGDTYVEDVSDVIDCSGDARVGEQCLDLVDPEVEFITACNLVLNGNLCTQATGVAVPGSRNLLFTVPWKSRTIIGTWYFDDERQRRCRDELSRICLEEARSFLAQRRKSADIADFHLGRLPAVRSRGGGATPAQSRLLRRCRLLELHDNSPRSRLFVVRGTKYTNAPRFARQVAESLYGPTRHDCQTLPVE